MPIYEFACPKCRRIFSFLSKRLNPDRQPVCPKCGSKNLVKQISGFAMIKGVAEPFEHRDSNTLHRIRRARRNPLARGLRRRKPGA